MEGILKQQCINDEGLYVWQKKYFKLDVNSLKFDIFGLQDAERKTPTFSIPLNSLKYAKEWSFSSAMGGYGFDLVWFSGNDWSFLVENEKDCQEWVKWINEGISLSNGSKKPASISKEVLETINSHKEFLSSLNSESYQEEYSSLLNKTKQELSSPITLMNNPQEETKTAAKYENRDNVPVHRRTSNIIHEITQDNPFQGLRSPLISTKNRYDQTNDPEEGEEFKQSSHHHNNATLVDQTISPIPNKGSNADSESEHSAPLSIHQYESSTLPPLPPSSNNDNFSSRRASSSITGGGGGAVNFEENNSTNNPARRTSTISKPDEAQTTTSSSTRRASTVNNNTHLHQEETTNSTTTRRTSVAMENSNQNSTNNNQTSSRRASVATPTQETTSPTRRRSTVSTPQETTRRSSTVSHPQEEPGSTRRSSVSNNNVQEHPRRSSLTNTPTQQENSTSRRASVTPATASPEGVANRRTSVSAAPNNISPKRSSIANTQERRTSVTNSQEKSNNSPSRRSSVANTPDSTTRRSSVSRGNTGNSNRRSSSTGGSPDKKEGSRQRSPSKRVSVVSKENVDQDSMIANDRSLHMTSLNNTTTVPNDLSRIFPSTDQYDNTTRYLNNNNLNNASDPLSPHRINSQSYQPFAHPPPPHSYNQPQQHYQQQQQELPLYSSYPSSSTLVTSAMKDQYLSNMKNIFQETKNSLYLTENELQDCRMNNNNITTNLK
jgi:hypothetical protein